VTLDKEKKKKRTISAAVEILGNNYSDEPEDVTNGLIRPGKTTIYKFQ
jgi:hypothetical protein